MRFLHSPVFYLVGSNLLLWGVPLALVHLRQPQLAELSLRQSLVPDPAQAALQVPQLSPPGNKLTSVAEPVSAVPAVVASSVEVLAPSQPVDLPEPLPAAPPLNLMQELRGAAGLGGPITLESLKEPLMPVAARVERQQQKRSGDTLAALPRHWRDSLRQELPAAKPVSEAAVVRLPVPALKQRQEVPVIVNEQGEGEALVAPQDPRVRQAVEGWAARQAAARPGTVQVFVVAAEPLETGAP